MNLSPIFSEVRLSPDNTPQVDAPCAQINPLVSIDARKEAAQRGGPCRLCHKSNERFIARLFLMPTKKRSEHAIVGIEER